jgi:hypothetical protein
MERVKLLPRGSDIGILRKLLLITSSRRLGVRVNKPINLERLISEGQNRKAPPKGNHKPFGGLT